MAKAGVPLTKEMKKQLSMALKAYWKRWRKKSERRKRYEEGRA